MELHTILSVLSIIQVLATLILIPVVRIVWDIKVYMEKDKLMKDIIIKDIEELKREIKRLDNYN